MQNAAIYFHHNAFDTTTGRLLGRHAAGESFLRGFLRHADVDRFHFWNVIGQGETERNALIERIEPPTKPIRWVGPMDRGSLVDPGVLSIPSPGVPDEAWSRSSIGPGAYAICGLTHTTATEAVMGIVSDLLIAPTEDYDALICTSSAVRASVETQLDGVRAYLAQEFGPRRRAEPQRVTIPLGINTADYATSPEQRTKWREQLGIPESATVALYVGRFNVREKMNPALMAIALEQAAQALGQPLYWVNAGWAEAAAEEEIYHRETRALCPTVHYLNVDGREPDVRFSIWSVADFFISFSDNVQETFGLTPVEAMAAGLPCVVTDWNGYKDTVRHGEDGFRVPTVAPPAGSGGDLSFRFANKWITYTNYVGAAAQYVAIDYAAAVTAICALAGDEDLRKRLGQQAKAHARAMFDWAAIIPQYQALWAEQNARRLAAPPQARFADNPFRPDPYRLFANYPTRHLALEDQLTLAPGMTWERASALLASQLAVYSEINRPTNLEVETIVAWLATRPGSSVADLLAAFPQNRRPFINRGVLWIARYGVISIRSPG
jgi:glycosyltransferase involved in cell wall biosynthesis